ncbi:hypothetical protein B0H10DRAFT_1966362 [Mycena sp. CBHHK59/15]|nr:hypothetical protein B0H10DRAFT_1966362 [Mycena sp. CBHHK59/15]
MLFKTGKITTPYFSCAHRILTEIETPKKSDRMLPRRALENMDKSNNMEGAIQDGIICGSDDDEPDLEESDNVWKDEGISSHVLIGDYRVTAKVKVGRLEYVLASIDLPIHRIPTALIVNLEDPNITFMTRMVCYIPSIFSSEQGCFACKRVDLALIQVERYELDLASRDAVFAAQRETRRREGTTAEDTAATYDLYFLFNFFALIVLTGS